MDPQHPPQQAPHLYQSPKTREFIKCLGEFFKRDLISIPVTKKHAHQTISQRCGLKASTLELDTAAYPNIDYIAGNRLSIYPPNPADQVQAIMKHLVDDISPLAATANQQPAYKRPRMTEPWAKFVQLNGKDSLRLALTFLYDITTAPSRDLLRLMADCCSNREQKSKLINISKSDEAWEKWVCQSLHTLKSTLDEFSSCSMSAKSLISELSLQQPRQYSISSIKSTKRFRTEIIVFQHRFTAKQIASSLQNIKEHEKIQNQDAGVRAPRSPISVVHPTTVHVSHNGSESTYKSSNSVRSLRSVVAYGASPISTQQVKRVPSYSGPLMSMYASSSMMGARASKTGAAGSNSGSGPATTNGRQSRVSLATGAPAAAGARSRGSAVTAAADGAAPHTPPSGSISEKQYDGLCSNYLLNLNLNDYIVCEFVENPRFTLKGNRERPIMMIGQDVGVVAFRPFWQQRALEHDRAQVFYTLFKDLSPKKFGDMQLVCLTGHRCRIEDLFKREINSVVTNKILSSASYINKSHLISLLDSAAAHSQSGSLAGTTATTTTTATTNSTTARRQQQQPPPPLPPIDQLLPKELIELGNRISKLLVDSNGCLYTCCDPQMTQAIEILVVESVARNNSSLSRDKIMALLPRWKGRKMNEQPLTNNKFLFTLENPFERAQIVQEIYDSSI